MKLNDQQAQKRMISRLRRIEGQLRGVQSMVEENRDCHEIMQQMAAIRSAVQSASQTMLEEYSETCLMNISDSGDPMERKLLLKDLIALIGRAP
jgi:DNA-binding FrmR family transcriptional regulator